MSIHDVGAHAPGNGASNSRSRALAGDAVCREIATVEIARGALIEVEEIGVVEPFEIEQLQDRLAHTDIGKNRPARVEDQALHAFRQSVGQVFLDDAAFAQRRKFVSGLPAAGIGFDAQIVETFLEGLEMRVAVAIIVDSGWCRNSRSRD